jgi:hypothetical protein
VEEEAEEVEPLSLGEMVWSGCWSADCDFGGIVRKAFVDGEELVSQKSLFGVW